jgi:hypothetical protein
MYRAYIRKHFQRFGQLVGCMSMRRLHAVVSGSPCDSTFDRAGCVEHLPKRTVFNYIKFYEMNEIDKLTMQFINGSINCLVLRLSRPALYAETAGLIFISPALRQAFCLLQFLPQITDIAM